MRIFAAAPAFLAICIALLASRAAPAEFARRGSVIYISGEIGSDEYIDFMEVRGDLRHGTIVLNSPGGYNGIAMMIGFNIQLRQFETVVRSGDFLQL